jgi:hypothetical protein
VRFSGKWPASLALAINRSAPLLHEAQAHEDFGRRWIDVFLFVLFIGSSLRAGAKIKSQTGFNRIVPLGENIVRVES